MKLISDEQAKKIPELYAQEEVKDPTVYMTIRHGESFWLITEFDPSNRLAFGYAQIFAGGGELGYIHLPELERLALLHPFEATATERKLSELKKELQ